MKDTGWNFKKLLFFMQAKSLLLFCWFLFTCRYILANILKALFYRYILMRAICLNFYFSGAFVTFWLILFKSLLLFFNDVTFILSIFNFYFLYFIILLFICQACFCVYLIITEKHILHLADTFFELLIIVVAVSCFLICFSF